MDTQLEFEALRRESSSWWYISRRKLLRDAVVQAVRGKREARILDLGCTAQLEFADSPYMRILNAHSSLPVLAFQQIEGCQDLICTRAEELALASNSFDAIVAGDILQSLPDDLAALRELRRVLKDGGSLCLTVPAYPGPLGRGRRSARPSKAIYRQRVAAQTQQFRLRDLSRIVSGGCRFSAFHPRTRGQEHVQEVHSAAGSLG